jgi:site-specific DNA-methyltransferase (adenine-specific)
MAQRRRPGVVRDAIMEAFHKEKRELTVAEIRNAVSAQLGEDVPASSIRSYLNLNTPEQFLRSGRGRYRLVRR